MLPGFLAPKGHAALVLAAVAVVVIARTALAESTSSTMESLIWGEWAGNGDLATIDAYGRLALRSNDSRSVEYEVSPWTYIPLVHFRLPDGEGGRKDVINYNFRAPINWLSWAAASLLAGVDRDDEAAVMASPWCYALFAPNCLVRYRLIGNLKLALGTRTDFLLYRTSSTARGILITPQIGLDFSGGKYGDSNAYSGISVALGSRNWWSFDGNAESEEIVISARLWGIPFTY